MSDITKAINWMKIREGKVTYSMNQRLGPNSYDCSSAVFYALIAAGYLPSNQFIGNTETLYALEKQGLLVPIKRSEASYGDLFVSGVKGGSLGSGGHTGLFLSNSTIIHCTYGKNGIATTPAYQWMGDYSGLPVHCYRLKGKGTVKPPETGNGSQQNKIAEDGKWGYGTSKRLQEHFGLAVRDGIISHQFKSASNQNIYSAQFDNTGIGSMLVIAMQEWLGVEQDGNFGPDSVRALQRKMGTEQDGIISPVSLAVMELQRLLNKNKL